MPSGFSRSRTWALLTAPAAMFIKERSAADFAPTTEADFHEIWGYLGMELEVMLP